jgi:hypothetical protein
MLGRDSSGGRHRPLADGRCHCRVTGEGDGAREKLVRAVNRRDWGTTVPGVQRLCAGGVRGSGAVWRGH